MSNTKLEKNQLIHHLHLMNMSSGRMILVKGLERNLDLILKNLPQQMSMYYDVNTLPYLYRSLYFARHDTVIFANADNIIKAPELRTTIMTAIRERFISFKSVDRGADVPEMFGFTGNIILLTSVEQNLREVFQPLQNLCSFILPDN